MPTVLSKLKTIAGPKARLPESPLPFGAGVATLFNKSALFCKVKWHRSRKADAPATTASEAAADAAAPNHPTEIPAANDDPDAAALPTEAAAGAADATTTTEVVAANEAVLAPAITCTTEIPAADEVPDAAAQPAVAPGEVSPPVSGESETLPQINSLTANALSETTEANIDGLATGVEAPESGNPAAEELDELEEVLPEKTKEEEAAARAKSEHKRSYVVQEILTTEEAYCSNIGFAVEMYYRPIKGLKILSKADIALIFSNIEAIHEGHKPVLDRVKAMRSGKCDIAGVLFEICKLGKLYESYTGNSPEAQKRLHDLKKENTDLKLFLREQNAKLPKHLCMGLDSFLIAPGQRVAKYRQLVEDLIKCTPKEHYEYPVIQMALREVKWVATLADLGGKYANKPLSPELGLMYIEPPEIFCEASPQVTTASETTPAEAPVSAAEVPAAYSAPAEAPAPAHEVPVVPQIQDATAAVTSKPVKMAKKSKSNFAEIFSKANWCRPRRAKAAVTTTTPEAEHPAAPISVTEVRVAQEVQVVASTVPQGEASSAAAHEAITGESRNAIRNNSVISGLSSQATLVTAEAVIETAEANSEPSAEVVDEPEVRNPATDELAEVEGMQSMRTENQDASERGKAEYKRSCLIQEIIKTEKNYNANLGFGVQIYECPIRETKIIPEVDVDLIFSNVATLQKGSQVRLHLDETHFLQRVLKSVTDRQSGGQTDIAGFFFSVCRQHRAYEAYLSKSVEAQQRLQELKRTNPEFKLFLREQNARLPNHLRMGLAPVQRIAHYNELLEQLVQCTPPDHYEHEVLQLALREIRSCTFEHRISQTMGLAGPRMKQRISADPQNKKWANDTEKAGYKMLKAMGWSDGKGLGRNEDGMATHLAVKMKNDKIGVGAAKNASDNWLEHTAGFSALLANLNSVTPDEDEAEDADEAEEEKPAAKKAKKNKKKKQVDDAAEDEEEKPRKKRKTENDDDDGSTKKLPVLETVNLDYVPNLNRMLGNGRIANRRRHVIHHPETKPHEHDALEKILGTKKLAKIRAAEEPSSTPTLTSSSDSDRSPQPPAATLAPPAANDNIVTAGVAIEDYFAKKLREKGIAVPALLGKKREGPAGLGSGTGLGFGGSGTGLGFGGGGLGLGASRDQDEDEAEEKPRVGLGLGFVPGGAGGAGLGAGSLRMGFGGLGFVKAASPEESKEEEKDAGDAKTEEKEKKGVKEGKKKKTKKAQEEANEVVTEVPPAVEEATEEAKPKKKKAKKTKEEATEVPAADEDATEEVKPKKKKNSKKTEAESEPEPVVAPALKKDKKRKASDDAEEVVSEKETKKQIKKADGKEENGEVKKSEKAGAKKNGKKKDKWGNLFKDSASYNVGMKLHGYEVQKIKPVEEFDLTAVQLKHLKTGADHLHIFKNDTNNVFNVAFLTAPFDSTGVPHILEHTALCGSVKYPIRDPFFKMLNRSVATYMNALTGNDYPFRHELNFKGSDITMYPFSTENAKDFGNLMGVYLDAVLHPRLRSTDFRQEGWRLEHEDPKDPSSPIVFKGVVYNEMKGVFSDVNNIFLTRLQQCFYPGTTYGYVSGGHPNAITDLTHEQLVEFHRRHYHPSNAKFFTYGTLPLSEHLRRIDSEISKFEPLNPVRLNPLVAFDSPRRIVETCPFDPMGDPERQVRLSISYLTNDATNTFETFAMQILSTLLIDSAASPFYKELIETNIGTDYAPSTGYDKTAKETSFSIGLQGLKESDVDMVEQKIYSVFAGLKNGGFFARDRVEAALHQLELGVRHNIQKMRLALNEPGFFERLIDKYFLNNNHKLVFIMKPSKEHAVQVEENEKKRLEEKVKNLSEQDKKVLHKDGLELLKLQEAPEDLGCLPTVTLEDIPVVGKTYPVVDDTLSNNGVSLQIRETATNGVSYTRISKSIQDLPSTLIPYLSLYSSAFTALGTVKTPLLADLDEKIRRVCSGISVSPVLTTLPTGHEIRRELQYYTSALDSKLPEVYPLVAELIQGAKFDDPAVIERVRTVLGGAASGGMASLAQNGHRYAVGVAASSLSPFFRHRELLGGVSSVIFTNHLFEDGENGVRTLLEKIKDVTEFALNDKGQVRAAVNCLGSSVDENKKGLSELFGSLGWKGSNDAKLPNTVGKKLFQQTANHIQSGAQFVNTFYVFPFNVNYTGQAYLGVPYLHEDSVKLQALGELLTHRFLHREVREKGGAYGAFAGYNALDGVFSMASYRDPPGAATRTFDAFTRGVEWAFDITKNVKQSELDEAKMSLLAGLNSPLSASDEAVSRFTSGITDEMRQKRREQIFALSLESVEQVALKYLARASSKAVLGPKQEAETLNPEKWNIQAFSPEADGEQ
ncbi:Presequence protease, mitochondrial [Phlyctochytrium bullatum]|nr:Presequence protease, mitochondrial [Phlyctochytrium bullatum]